MNLIHTLQLESNDKDKFYTILERIIKQPKQYMDLLELVYLCLSYGFKGKYRYLKNGGQELNKIIDNAYHTIAHSRSHFKKALSSNHNKPKKYSRLTSTIVAITTIAIVIILYSGFKYVSAVSVNPLLQQLNNLSE